MIMTDSRYLSKATQHTHTKTANTLNHTHAQKHTNKGILSQIIHFCIYKLYLAILVHLPPIPQLAQTNVKPYSSNVLPSDLPPPFLPFFLPIFRLPTPNTSFPPTFLLPPKPPAFLQPTPPLQPFTNHLRPYNFLPTTFLPSTNIQPHRFNLYPSLQTS